MSTAAHSGGNALLSKPSPSAKSFVTTTVPRSPKRATLLPSKSRWEAIQWFRPMMRQHNPRSDSATTLTSWNSMVSASSSFGVGFSCAESGQRRR